MLGLLVLGMGLGAGVGQTPKTVSFTALATPLVRLMPVLADLIHQPLKATTGVENEVLCIDVHDVRPDELLKRIAQATGCRWSQESGRIYLVPDDRARRKLASEGLAKRAAQLDQAFEKFNPALKAPSPNFLAQRPEQAKATALFYSILKRIGASALANVKPGDRVVYSSRPTARQAALPELGSDDLAAYFQTEAKARQRLAAASENRGGPEIPKAEAVAKIDFVVDRRSVIEAANQIGLTVTLVLYDRNGKELDRNRLSFYDDPQGYLFDRSRQGDDASASRPPQPAEDPIEISPKSIEFDAQSRSGQPGTPARKVVDDELCHPQIRDPLAYPSEFLLDVASAKKLQLVASLPDAFASWYGLIEGTQLTPTLILRFLKSDDAIRIENTDGWLVVSPSDVSTEPIDRNRLAELSQRFLGKVSWSLDDLISLDEAGLMDPSRSVLLLDWLGRVDRDFQRFVLLQDWKFVHFMAVVTPPQREALAAGKSIRFGEFGPSARVALEAAAYGDTFRTNPAYGPLQIESNVKYFSQPDVEVSLDGMGVADSRGEPTELAPNGLPANGLATAQTLEQTVVFPTAGAGSSAQPPTPNLERFAFIVAMSEPGLSPSRNAARAKSGLAGFEKVNLGVESAMNFRFYLGPESFAVGKIVIRSISTDQTYTPKTLPPDIQTKFDALLKATEERIRTSNPRPPPTQKTGPP